MHCNPFWDYSLKVYQHDEVSSRLLLLQNRFDVDVNMVLCCCWLGASNQELNAHHVEQLMSLCRSWRLNCLLPVRSTRLYLKGKPVSDELYDQAKALELGAERWQQDLMYKCLQSLSLNNTTVEVDEQVLRNLQVYTSCLPQVQWQQVELLYRELGALLSTEKG